MATGIQTHRPAAPTDTRRRVSVAAGASAMTKILTMAGDEKREIDMDLFIEVHSGRPNSTVPWGWKVTS